MKKFIIEITDDKVYINGNLHCFGTYMDNEDKETDMDKKALLALADEMGYETPCLFEEMADRLNEMLDEFDF
jgi:hypothetical protein